MWFVASAKAVFNERQISLVLGLFSVGLVVLADWRELVVRRVHGVAMTTTQNELAIFLGLVLDIAEGCACVRSVEDRDTLDAARKFLECCPDCGAPSADLCDIHCTTRGRDPLNPNDEP